MTRSTRLIATSIMLASAVVVTACGDDGPISSPLTDAPRVTATSPASVGVARNAAITAEFSEAMTLTTINTTTFSLKTGSTNIPSVVTFAGTTARLVPVAILAANTTYTATITTDVQDLQGENLASAKTWSFTTVATSVGGPAAVNLGSAANYAILAKAGISTTGVSSVLGNLGISPAGATAITGFDLTSPATTFTTSAIVTGQVYASNYTAPTPASLTTAVADMQTAYTNAAGRTLPDFIELGGGNISGMTLAPGLYKWGTGVEVTSGVTLNGGANDVWIFQIAQNLVMGNGAMVTLTGGAQAKNVFWQVGGAATLGTTVNFKGIILSSTLISMNTGTIMTGRALAQTAVTMNATALSIP